MWHRQNNYTMNKRYILHVEIYDSYRSSYHLVKEGPGGWGTSTGAARAAGGRLGT